METCECVRVFLKFKCGHNRRGGGEGGEGGGAVPWFVYLFMRLDVAERAEPPSAKRRSRDLDVYPHFVFHPDRQRSEVRGQRTEVISRVHGVQERTCVLNSTNRSQGFFCHVTCFSKCAF